MCPEIQAESSRGLWGTRESDPLTWRLLLATELCCALRTSHDEEPKPMPKSSDSDIGSSAGLLAIMRAENPITGEPRPTNEDMSNCWWFEFVLLEHVSFTGDDGTRCTDISTFTWIKISHNTVLQRKARFSSPQSILHFSKSLNFTMFLDIDSFDEVSWDHGATNERKN